MKHAWIITLFLSLNLYAQEEVNHGIHFFHGTWEEACWKAQAEDKLVFADFYTRWCGPCLNMAENVFTLSFVGDFYNEHFVCVKVDAEHGEGVALAKRYEVRSYPTYLFIDPANGDVLHRSRSRQDAEVFLETGKSALDPCRRSPYLEAEYAAGSTDKTVLEHYIRYCASIYEREQVREAFDRLMGSGVTLAEAWDLFSRHITGMDNPYMQQVVADYPAYVEAVGKEAVDDKLRREARYCTLEELERLPAFEGKTLCEHMARINALVREERYDEADAAIRAAMADTTIDQQAFIEQFRFTVRGSCWREDTPVAWLTRCASYLQYIAYNAADRDDAFIHQEYAAMLERLIRQTPGAEGVFPASIVDKPEFGVKDYNMRLRNLAPKPARKK